jgi:hypothetical protein
MHANLLLALQIRTSRPFIPNGSLAQFPHDPLSLYHCKGDIDGLPIWSSMPVTSPLISDPHPMSFHPEWLPRYMIARSLPRFPNDSHPLPC